MAEAFVANSYLCSATMTFYGNKSIVKPAGKLNRFVCEVEHLHYLTDRSPDPVSVTAAALVGDDGWGDATQGDYERTTDGPASTIFQLIEDFCHRPRRKNRWREIFCKREARDKRRRDSPEKLASPTESCVTCLIRHATCRRFANPCWVIMLYIIDPTKLAVFFRLWGGGRRRAAVCPLPLIPTAMHIVFVRSYPSETAMRKHAQPDRHHWLLTLTDTRHRVDHHAPSRRFSVGAAATPWIEPAVLNYDRRTGSSTAMRVGVFFSGIFGIARPIILYG